MGILLGGEIFLLPYFDGKFHCNFVVGSGCYVNNLFCMYSWERTCGKLHMRMLSCVQTKRKRMWKWKFSFDVFTPVILFTGGGGGVCPIACWDTHPPGQTSHPGQTTPRQIPPSRILWVRSTSQRYASYWNAYLFSLSFLHVFWSFSLSSIRTYWHDKTTLNRN